MCASVISRSQSAQRFDDFSRDGKASCRHRFATVLRLASEGALNEPN
jgi:hypothetical protein